jgi:superfamily II DNA or RNA helicase
LALVLLALVLVVLLALLLVHGVGIVHTYSHSYFITGHIETLGLTIHGNGSRDGNTICIFLCLNRALACCSTGEASTQWPFNRSQRVRVDLTSEERAAYDTAYKVYTGFVRERGLQRSHGPGWLGELMRLSALDPAARRALLARRQLLNILDSCQGKFAALESLLREHTGERVLVFTESNAVAYTIARQYLVPVISHEIGVAERKHILDGFQAGHYSVIATSKVLNEGVDVPEAKVAIVLGGEASKREYLQRLGRILRKKEPLQALLVEVLVRNTIEEGKVQRRHVPREKR